MIDRKVSDALFSLGITEWYLKQEPTNETEFLANFAKIVGEDSNSIAIESTNPSDFGVTWQQINTEMQRLETLGYQKLRAKEYPTIGDQLDALWKGGDAAAEMLAKVQAVKNKYPKGTE
jgi:hypothetical protein